MNNSTLELEQPRSSIRLDEITLRGIGPYFHEARLAIRPITILCGQNSSGKSTWFKVVKFLQDASNCSEFPSGFDPSILPVISGTRTLLNSHIAAGAKCTRSILKERSASLLSEVNSIHDLTEEYGPFGTIGFTTTVCVNTATSVVQSGPRGDIVEPISAFINNEVGDKVRILLTLQSGFIDIDRGEPDVISALTVYKNDTFMFSLRRGSTVVARNIYEAVYGGEVNGEIITIDAGMADVDYALDLQLKRETTFPTDDENRLVVSCISFAKTWTHLAASSASLIFANRSAVDDSFLEGEAIGRTLENALSYLNVGRHGERTMALERAFAKSICSQEGDYSKNNLDGVIESLVEAQLADKNLTPEDFQRRADKIGAVIRKKVYCVDKPEKVAISSLPIEEQEDMFFVESNIAPIRIFSNWMSYEFHWYFHYWMSQMLDFPYKYPWDLDLIPTGFLHDRHCISIEDEARDRATDFYTSFNPDRHTYGTLIYPARAETLSSGFHHLAPLIVQTGIMWQAETLMVESPEAHLHPSLQLRLMEYFLLHAISGRQFVLETHSDLVVRRILRAILEEEISQSSVSINFTRIDNISAHPDCGHMKNDWGLSAYIEGIKVNQKGQIANWPEGFLDADVLESRRLIDAMYGCAEENEDV